MEKRQFNARLPLPLRRAAINIADRLDWTREEIAEVAYATLFGSNDRLILAKKEKVEEVVKQLSLSFNDAEPQSVGMAA